MFTNTVDLNASFLLTYVDKALSFIIIIHGYLWHQLYTRKRNFVLSNECLGHDVMLKSYFLDFLAIELPEQTQRRSKKFWLSIFVKATIHGTHGINLGLERERERERSQMKPRSKLSLEKYHQFMTVLVLVTETF